MSCDNPHEITHLDSLFPQLVVDLLRDGKSVRFRAVGRSMYPTIREGDVITVAPIAPDFVQRGDIILYRLECGVVAHRLVRIDRNREDSFRYIFRSDTWGAWDDPVLAEQILGKVISVERSGRSIQVYSGKMKIRLLAHAVASRLSRWIN
jgi:signal peptidase I